MKPYNYQAVWSDYSEWILQKNDVQNFNGQLNFTIIETHENERGRENLESLWYTFDLTVLISLTFSLPLLRWKRCQHGYVASAASIYLDTHTHPTNIRCRVYKNHCSIQLMLQPVTDDRGLVRVSLKLLKKKSGMKVLLKTNDLTCKSMVYFPSLIFSTAKGT